MPLYVKAGAIIPMQPVMQYVDERSLDPLTLRVWQGDGEFTLYEDDGHTFAYKDNAYTTTKFSVNTEENQVIFGINQREGSLFLPSREVIVELVGVGKQRFNDDGTARQLVFNLKPQ